MEADQFTSPFRILAFAGGIFFILAADAKAQPGGVISTIRTVEVTSLSDDFNAPGCTLREALLALKMQSNDSGCILSVVGGSGPDRIEFNQSLAPGQIFLDKTLLVESDVVIRGPGRNVLFINGSRLENDGIMGTDPLIRVSSGGFSLTIEDLTLTESTNASAVSGRTLTLNRVRISNSFTSNGSGGAVNGNQVTVRDSDFLNNSAFVGGAIDAEDIYIESSNFVGNAAESGGAISAFGQLTVINSSFEDNSAITGGGALYLLNGDAMVEKSTFLNNNGEASVALQDVTGSSEQSLSIVESLIVDQVATPSGQSLFGQPTASATPVALRLENTTVIGQRSIQIDRALELSSATITIEGAGAPPALVLRAGSQTDLINSIVVSAGMISCVDEGATMARNQNNIYSAGPCTQAEANLILDDPMLGPLQDNGGPTLSIAPQTGSPAIDAGTDSCPNVDQRGFLRTAGPCDIGAIEAGFRERIFLSGFEG